MLPIESSRSVSARLNWLRAPLNSSRMPNTVLREIMGASRSDLTWESPAISGKVQPWLAA